MGSKIISSKSSVLNLLKIKVKNAVGAPPNAEQIHNFPSLNFDFSSWYSFSFFCFLIYKKAK